jgi:hypothetical protein
VLTIPPPFSTRWNHPSGSSAAFQQSLIDDLARDKPPEIIRKRAFNNPNLTPQEFLLALMHDEDMPVPARIEAAKAVSVYIHPRLAQVTQEISAGVKIVIEGGLPSLPGTHIIMPDGLANTSGSTKPNGSGEREE